jgi:hypothetical protein
VRSPTVGVTPGEIARQESLLKGSLIALEPISLQTDENSLGEKQRSRGISDLRIDKVNGLYTSIKRIYQQKVMKRLQHARIIKLLEPLEVQAFTRVSVQQLFTEQKVSIREKETQIT